MFGQKFSVTLFIRSMLIAVKYVATLRWADELLVAVPVGENWEFL